MSVLRDTWLLGRRSLREARLQPGIEIGNIFIPLFFFFVTIGSLERVAKGAFGVDDFVGFQVPVALLQAVATGTAGSGLVTDIQRGYFDKLSLTPAPRVAIVLGRMLGDGVRAAVLGTIIIVAGLIIGARIETGVPGFFTLIGIGVVFSLAFSGLGVALALRTGSNQAVQLTFLLFFPLIFLSPAFAPKEVFSGWLKVLAEINPFTYILEACRALVLEGWDGAALAKGFIAIGAMAVFSVGFIAWGYRKRRP